MVVHKLLCLGCDNAARGSTNKGDVGGGCDGEGAVTIGGSSKSQVCQREEHATLHIAASIQMARLYAYLCTGLALCYFYYLNAVLPRKLIVQEEIF